MTFPSILFLNPGMLGPDAPPPACFGDLRLDRIVSAITAGREEHRLATFFHQSLGEVEAVVWRQEIVRDFEGPVGPCVRGFAGKMRAMRECRGLAAQLSFPLQKQRWFLDAADAYGEAVETLARGPAPAARGLAAFHAPLLEYAASEGFQALRAETRRILTALDGLQYIVSIHGLRVRIEPGAGEADYTREIEDLFAPFQAGEAAEYHFAFSESREMNPVEEKILARMAELFPEPLAALAAFAEAHRDFAHPAILAFDREAQFYLAYLDYIARFRAAGLEFCYPSMVALADGIASERGFDLALADRLLAEKGAVVVNDFSLRPPERMVVVTGPNQGGKSTFARAFGQMHYLASLGLPVPGARAQLFLPERIFTHFEKEDPLMQPGGRLHDDLVRVHAILERATACSLLIFNETLGATALRDAVVLGRAIAARIETLGAGCVWVTFIEELAALGPWTVSMTSTVVTGDPARRTFQILRRPADGLAYAAAIAERHGLTYDRIRERLTR